jgi:hypothetical protein
LLFVACLASLANQEQAAFMAVEKEPTTSRSDENFRKGACHGARWLLETSRTLVAQGRSAEEISEYLAELCGVLCHWREHMGEMPDGNPWDWSFKDLASVIKTRKDD